MTKLDFKSILCNPKNIFLGLKKIRILSLCRLSEVNTMKAISSFFFSLFSLLVGFSASAEPTLNVSADAGNNSLELDGEGTSSTRTVKVSDVSVSTTNPNGYTLTITSGSITKIGGQDIDYQVTAVDDGDSEPSIFNVASGSNYEKCTATANVSTDLLDVYIRYTSASLQDPGNYSDTISITAVDNDSGGCS